MGLRSLWRQIPPRRIGFWTVLFGLLVPVFLGVAVLRYARGLGAVTHLSDRYPWGLWIGFDLLCGVGLAAGGFTLAAVVHLFHLKRFEPILRPTILTAFLGYVFVIVALLFDLGQPWRIWHPMVFWNPHSVMFEVAWCVILYTGVLALEFSPAVLERLGLTGLRRLVRVFMLPLVIAGVLLSTLHQSSLGSLYLIVPAKLHPLWYTPLLPFYFFLSAVGAGIAMIVLESHLSGRAFGRPLEADLLEPLARAMVVILGIYGLLRLEVLYRGGLLGSLVRPGYEEGMFLLEFVLGVIAPVGLLAWSGIRSRPAGLVAGSLLVVLGFILNRLNVSVTGLERAAGARYLPSWMEVVVSLGIVSLGVACFALGARFFPVFASEGEGGEPEGVWGAPAP